MVFLSALNFVTRTGFDKSFKRARILKMSGFFYGRRRNCYRIAIKAVQKALMYTTVSRKIKPDHVNKLRITRIDAACRELDTDYTVLTSNLMKCNVNLGNKVLQDLAIWEPRTFKCLTDIARVKNKIEAPKEVSDRLKAPDNVITRGML